MRIFLIGMPGSGKSTIARNLAKEIGYQYVDLDGIIEKDAKMFCEDIIEKYGEDKFRELESEALTKLPKGDLVVACGGGIVIKKSNKALMDGINFYLDTDLDMIKERLETDYQRPLLKQKTLEQLFDERYLKYQDFADAVVSNNYDVDMTVKVIKNYLRNEVNK
ncbi:shikimate kinase [Peloplasma aerotolerans]|jgi:shikimate kinase|uniref:Shikimate kinase n=1 Tax=Peloplasma aerotolerans TaxID=3044389 RepID=A0AAW6U9L0_9MOLU|nr:shikimate kinase [Mariniplasma sp. M4Ah]MDI6452334.1 shikimate kinase [Mariniplasma sp. M4Ah]MDR4968302.1 shikimate kinase [Acholeplasmataceae bacterium]